MDGLQDQRERATANVESLRTRARDFKEQLTATKRDMRRAARTLKTYEARQRVSMLMTSSSRSPAVPHHRRDASRQRLHPLLMLLMT